MFWIICAALTGAVGLAIMAPLLRARGDAAQPAAAFDLRVYRDQLQEVERDLERGVIAPDAREGHLDAQAGRHIVAITDPGSQMQRVAEREWLKPAAMSAASGKLMDWPRLHDESNSSPVS